MILPSLLFSALIASLRFPLPRLVRKRMNPQAAPQQTLIPHDFALFCDLCALSRQFRISDFGLLSNFGFRISDFSFRPHDFAFLCDLCVLSRQPRISDFVILSSFVIRHSSFPLPRSMFDVPHLT
jgi:hypothetical protein